MERKKRKINFFTRQFCASQNKSGQSQFLPQSTCDLGLSFDWIHQSNRNTYERIETTNSRLQLTKIAQHKYSKDSKKINDRSGELEKR
jgi:hypothetical protein